MRKLFILDCQALELTVCLALQRLYQPLQMGADRVWGYYVPRPVLSNGRPKVHAHQGRAQFPGAVWDLAGKLFSEPGVVDAHVQMIGRWSTLYQRFSDWRSLGYSARG